MSRKSGSPGTWALALVSILLGGCQGLSRIDLTVLPGRASWQKPEQVVGALEIRPGDRVADLGAGDGYFVPYLSEAVGPNGRVFAVEVDDEVIGELRDRVSEEGYENVETVRGELEDPLLPDGSVDLVLIVNTYHHIEDRPAYFERLRGDLGEGGRVAIVEPNEDLSGILSLFLDEGHTSRAADVRREMEQAGYGSAGSFDLLPVQIFEVFTPNGSPRTEELP